MKRFRCSKCLLFWAVLSIPGALLAQGAPGVHIGLSGGADFPIEDQKDIYKTGWNGTALVAINSATSPWGSGSTARTTSFGQRTTWPRSSGPARHA